MIRRIRKNDLPACIDIFHKGYETVAVEFGLTEENCPDRGRASLPFEKIENDFENGVMMFGFLVENKVVGFLGIKTLDNGDCGLNDIIILPEYRGNGYGQALLDFCKVKAKELGAKKVRLGMIDDNTKLKEWYEANGFVNIRLHRFDGSPVTTGWMECTL